MPIATDSQIQAFVDSRIRPRCEQIRNLYNDIKSDIAEISDVYAALIQPSPTWTDTRTDNPPHLMTPSDVLAVNTVLNDYVKFIEGTFASQADANASAGQYAIVQEACVTAP